MGNNLNLTGSLAEWSTMQACIQQITYDLTAGRTTLAFGPAAHLGAKDFVERLRANRGPRWYNLNGNNLQNAPNQTKGAELGQDVSQLNPSHGPRAADLQTCPVSIADLAAHSYTSTGPPGVTVDARASGQPNYGDLTSGVGSNTPIASPAKPTIFLANGSAGSLTGWARLNVDDLYGKEVWFQEYPCYFDFGDGNGCVAAFVTLLGSYPYTTSVHA
jgi:hypothetical protein